ncbi:MAG: F0F1 ATP synthase subunit epsilon [candidate division NC10 bacterium]|nr:F0F1 ATP synthase subunit epsilon [candidate division NC10 bacterium]
MAEKSHDTFLLEVVTPHRLVVSEWVEELVAPGSEGYFGVLPGHIPFISTLKIGELYYRKGREGRYLAVNWGYAEVRPDKVIILAETAERAEEIDIERAESARGRALARLSRFGDETINFTRAQAALERALARLSVASKIR